MELYQLSYFRAIANFGSMAAAASAINVTQPALSYAVSQLEKELGVTLFLRRGGKLQLTSMGELLLETADRVIKELDACAERVRAEGAQAAGRVYIGVPYNGLISEAITSYIQTYPTIHLYETLPFLYTAYHSLEIGAVDFLVTYEAFHNPKILQIPLFQDQLVGVVREDSPLAKKPYLQMDDLKSNRIIYKGQPWTMMDLLSIEAKNVSPETYGMDMIYEGTDEHIALRLAEQGLGILLMPKSELEWKNKNSAAGLRYVKMATVPLEEEKYSRTIYMSYLKNTQLKVPAQGAFDFILHFYQNKDLKSEENE